MGAWTLSMDSATRELHGQAEQVFEFDRAHPGVLPAHQVRRLSLAIAFHNDAGARKLLGHLKALQN